MRSSEIKKRLPLLALAAALILFDRGLYLLIGEAEVHFYGEKNYRQELKTYLGEKPASVLVFGTSRAFEAIHPRSFSQALGKTAFQEASFGKGPRYFLSFYEYYRSFNPPPQAVIYGFDYFTFRGHTAPRWIGRFGQGRSLGDLFARPLLLLHEKTDIDSFLNDILKQATEKKKGRRPVRKLKNFQKVEAYTGNKAGAGRLITDRPAGFRKFKYVPYPGREGEYFIKLLDRLEAEGVPTFIVSLPDYYGTYLTNFQIPKMNKELREIDQKYPHVSFLNYNRPKKFPLDNPAYFFDGGYGKSNSHLSREGAQLLSRLLVEDIRKVLGRNP